MMKCCEYGPCPGAPLGKAMTFHAGDNALFVRSVIRTEFLFILIYKWAQ
jgi:hypothetical protein